MRIYKKCKRLDFSTGSLKTYYTISTDLLPVDIEYHIQQMIRSLAIPPRFFGR